MDNFFREIKVFVNVTNVYCTELLNIKLRHVRVFRSSISRFRKVYHSDLVFLLSYIEKYIYCIYDLKSINETIFLFIKF